MSDLDEFNESENLEDFTKATPKGSREAQYHLFYDLWSLNNQIDILSVFFQNDFQMGIESGKLTKEKLEDSFKELEFFCDNLCKNLEELKKVAKCQIAYFTSE